MTSTFFRHALPEGEILGDYQVVSVLGAGGFGVTYLVQHRTMGDRFALKEYFPQALADRQTDRSVVIRTNTFEDPYYKGLHSFLEEARIVRRLRGHPNVVHVNTFFEANNTAYMVMEYYSGQTLTSFRRQSGDHLDEPTIRRIFKPVLDALEYVHERGVVHRDLKPDNIFLCEDGRPILLDFGASRAAAAGSTVPLTAVLTPGYAPPEQYITEDSGETVLRQGPWTDLYALAATLHMIACGRAPYDAMSRRMAGATDPQPPARLRLEGYSESFCSAIDAALKLDHRERPQSVAEFRAIWDGQVRPAALPPTPAEVATQAPPRAAVAAHAAAPAAAVAARPSPAPAAPMAAQSTPAAGSKLPLLATLAALVLAAIGAVLWFFVFKPGAAGGKVELLTDARCQLRIGGKEAQVIETFPSTTVEIAAGDQPIECESLDGSKTIDRQLVTVQAGQTTRVAFKVAPQLAAVDPSDAVAGEPSVAAAAAEPEATEPAATQDGGGMQIIVLARPEFPEPVTGAPASGGPLGGKQLEQAGNEVWFVQEGAFIDTATGPTSLGQAPAFTRHWKIPEFVPQEYDGQKLLKVINSGARVLSLYGPDFSSAYILLAQDAADGSEVYALDFSEYLKAPETVAGDEDYVTQQVVWAEDVEGMLFVATGHNTYARSSMNRNAYITALDTSEFLVQWRSPALVSNAQNFVIHGSHILTGYGFTEESDFLYALDIGSGEVVQRVPVKSGPEWLALEGGRLLVQTYDTDYAFALREP